MRLCMMYIYIYIYAVLARGYKRGRFGLGGGGGWVRVKLGWGYRLKAALRSAREQRALRVFPRGWRHQAASRRRSALTRYPAFHPIPRSNLPHINPLRTVLSDVGQCATGECRGELRYSEHPETAASFRPGPYCNPCLSRYQ